MTGQANQLVNALGFYPVRLDLDLLDQVEYYSDAILFLGLIFDIVILLFVGLSVLLIYSLLMISVESKTHEFGVMRMQGLNKKGIIQMVILQALMFVLPSIVVGFMASVPSLNMINKRLIP